MEIRRCCSGAVLGLLGLALVPASGCGWPPEAAPAQAQAQPRTEAAAGARAALQVVTVRPERTTLRRVTEQPGQIEPYEIAPLFAKVSGYVKAVTVDIGDAVARDQPLVELSAPEIEADLAQSQAAVRQAEAQQAQAQAAIAVARATLGSAESKEVEARAAIRHAEADLTRWNAELKRVAQLVRDSAAPGSLLDETTSKQQGATAARDELTAAARSAAAAVTESRAELDKANADAVAAEARTAVARAAQVRAQALASYLVIKAPFAGVITSRQVHPGHLTHQAAGATPLLVIARNDRVRVAVNVPELDAVLVSPGDRATVRLQALDNRVIEGKVSRTAWSLDTATRTLRAEIDLPNPDGALRPGLYATAAIVVEERPNALTLPLTAIVRQAQKPSCMAVASGRAVRHPLTLGLSDGTRVEILSGLTGDESVIATGADALTEGQAVESRP